MENAQKGNTVLVFTAYLLLASPFEVISWYFSHRSVKYAAWTLLLNCGTYLQAIVILVALTALAGFSSRASRVHNKQRVISERVALIVLGIVCGLAVSSAWWHAFRFAWGYTGSRGYIRGTPDLENGIAFYDYFSAFIAAYFGILAGDLAHRWSPECRAFFWTHSEAKLSTSSFVWISWIAWLALYRLSEWLWLLVIEVSAFGKFSLGSSYLSLLPLLATAIACIPVSYLLSLLKPKSKTSSISLSLAASLLIPVTATILLLTTGWIAIATLVRSILTLNATGFAWGWFVGGLRWRSIQKPVIAE